MHRVNLIRTRQCRGLRRTWHLGLDHRLIRRRIDFKRPFEIELTAHFAHGRNHFFAHQTQGLRIWSSWVMAPSPSQKKMLPGRKYSRTCRILGSTVLGVPEMIV